MHDTNRTHASLDAFADATKSDASDQRDPDPEDAQHAAASDRWPSRWTCPECGYSATYELHARVTPTCPRCLPDTFVRMEGQS